MNSHAEIRKRIAIIVKEVSPQIDAKDISDGTNLIEDGVLDSLGFLTLATRIQKEFNIEIPFDEYSPEEFTVFGKFVEICATVLPIDNKDVV